MPPNNLLLINDWKKMLNENFISRVYVCLQPLSATCSILNCICEIRGVVLQYSHFPQVKNKGKIIF